MTALCLKRCRSILIVLLCVGGLCIAARCSAAARQPSAIVSRKAMEVLRAECFACHNEEKKKGRLVLTSREALMKGNDEGVVVVAGKPDGFLGVIPFTTSQILARVCRSCGNIELFARNSQDILAVESDNE